MATGIGSLTIEELRDLVTQSIDKKLEESLGRSTDNTQNQPPQNYNPSPQNYTPSPQNYTPSQNYTPYSSNRTHFRHSPRYYQNSGPRHTSYQPSPRHSSPHYSPANTHNNNTPSHTYNNNTPHYENHSKYSPRSNNNLLNDGRPPSQYSPNKYQIRRLVMFC